MRGYWIGRSQALFATQKSPYQFDKLARTLNRRGSNSHTREFFVPEYECTEEYKEKNIPVEEQLDSQVLDQLVANVEFNSNDQDSLNRELKQARKQKILKQTKLIGEKLDERKKQLFYDWSEKFFQSFADHFGKLKNMIIQLHLNQQQVKNFTQTLDKCLENMRNDLNEIYDQFMQEQKINED